MRPENGNRSRLPQHIPDSKPASFSGQPLPGLRIERIGKERSLCAPVRSSQSHCRRGRSAGRRAMADFRTRRLRYGVLAARRHRTILSAAADRGIMSVSVAPSPTVEFGKPKLLFRLQEGIPVDPWNGQYQPRCQSNCDCSTSHTTPADHGVQPAGDSRGHRRATRPLRETRSDSLPMESVSHR